MATAALLLLLVAAASAIPVRYDQRQDGDWNVDARLQNFFVVFSPKNANSQAGGINILDLASKAIPLRPGSGLAAAAAAAAAAAGGTPNAANQEPQDRQSPSSGDVAEFVLVPAGRSALPSFVAPDSPAGAVPMLVAVPVPEVAPLPGAFVPALPLQSPIAPHHQPGALLPMLAVIKPGTTDKIIPVQSIPAEAIISTAEKAPASSEMVANPVGAQAPLSEDTLLQPAAAVSAEQPASPSQENLPATPAAGQDKKLI